MLNILITGANGSIGYELIDNLKDLHNLYLLDIKFNNLQQLNEDSNITFIKLNILDKNKIINFDYDIDVIIHLAGKVHVKPKSEKEKKEFYQINTEATKYLYELAIRKNIKHFIFISSISVYGKEFINAKENNDCVPSTPYAKSKYLAEQAGLKLIKEYDLPLTILRLATVYGKYDRGNYKKMINFAHKGYLPIIGEGKNKKAIVYVKDVVNLIKDIILDKKTYGEIYNVSEDNYTYENLITKIENVFDLNINKITIPTFIINLYKKIGLNISIFNKLETLSMNNSINNDKIKKELNYKLKYNFEEGLFDSMDYYKN